jgi:hypothetical protein
VGTTTANTPPDARYRAEMRIAAKEPSTESSSRGNLPPQKAERTVRKAGEASISPVKTGKDKVFNMIFRFYNIVLSFLDTEEFP